MRSNRLVGLSIQEVVRSAPQGAHQHAGQLLNELGIKKSEWGVCAWHTPIRFPTSTLLLDNTPLHFIANVLRLWAKRSCFNYLGHMLKGLGDNLHRQYELMFQEAKLGVTGLRRASILCKLSVCICTSRRIYSAFVSSKLPLFFFQLFIAAMSDSLQTSLSSVMKYLAD